MTSTPGELADAIAEELVSGNWHRLAARADRLSAVKAIIHSHLLRTIPSGADEGLEMAARALDQAAAQFSGSVLDADLSYAQVCRDHAAAIRALRSVTTTPGGSRPTPLVAIKPPVVDEAGNGA